MASIPASHRALLDAPVGVLATIGAADAPQATALWFLFDESEGVVRLSLSNTRQKTRNIQRHPKVSLLIFDPATPYRTIELRGSVQIADDPDYAFARQLGAKYGGADLRAMDGPGDSRVVVTLRPRKVLTWGE